MKLINKYFFYSMLFVTAGVMQQANALTNNEYLQKVMGKVKKHREDTMDMVKKIYSILIEAQKILNNFDKNLADSDPNRKVEIQLDDVLSLGIVEVYNKYISLKSYDIEKNVAAPAEGDFQKLVLENAQDEIESTNEWVKNNISQLIKNKAKAISEAGSQGVKEAMNKLQGFIYSG